MRRWVCQSCGSGVLAPGRPRMDDVRRYCLPCSEKTGRLVERRCPAAELESAGRTARRRSAKAEAAVRRRRREDLKHTVVLRGSGPVDLRGEMRRFWVLQIIRDRRLGRPPPMLEVWKVNRSSASGYADFGERKIHVSAGYDECDAVVTLLHEVVHMAIAPETGHGEKFWITFRLAAEQAWPGIDVPPLLTAPRKRDRHDLIRNAYREWEDRLAVRRTPEEGGTVQE